MKEFKMKKFTVIKLIYVVLIVIFLISAFLPYYSKYYPQYPPLPASPVIPSTTRYYIGYLELLYGGWPGLILLVISVLLINFGIKDKALIVGGVGCALIIINIIISTSYWARTIESGFYIGLIFNIGLIGINVVAFVSEDSVMGRDVEFEPLEEPKIKKAIKKPKIKLRSKVVEEVEPIEIKQEAVFGSEWEKKKFVEKQAIDYIKGAQLQLKELPFFKIISKTGIESKALNTLVDELIANKEINARVRDFVLIFKEITKEKKEELTEKIQKDLQKKLSDIDIILKGNKFNEAIESLNEIRDTALSYNLIEIVNEAKEKIDYCRELEIEMRKELDKQKITSDLQNLISGASNLIEENKFKRALRELEKVKDMAREYNLLEFLNQAKDLENHCKELEEEFLKDKELLKIEKKLQKRLISIEKLIEKNKLSDALEDLVEIKEIAQENDFAELVNIIEEKIDYCKHFQFNTINKIKNTILNYGSKLARLELMDITEKSGIQDIKIIEQVVLDMIKNREINAEYFSSSKSIAFYQQEKDIKQTSIQEEVKKLRVFLSYSTLDAEYFKIAEIVKTLEKYPEIKKASYWQADSKQNIVEFMEDTLKNTDVFVLFCSKNSVKSGAVKDEWQAAFQMRKKGMLKIVPIYEEEDDIPVLLWQMLNVKYSKDNFNSFIDKLHEEILR
ncbi:MAG: TIR domain-containing protein [Candidatus Lokiarchaeota archaeon]|nr:TIR domain-containing protein [Candidatus Lokiarchaeota archaeon]